MHINPLQAYVPILIPLKTEQWLEWINLFEWPISINFLTFCGGIEMGHWREKGYYAFNNNSKNSCCLSN